MKSLKLKQLSHEMLMHKNIGEVICYPNPSHQQLINRINELRQIGVISIILDGKKLLNGK